MLKIPKLPRDEQAAEIVRDFINNRLIAMMERIIEEEMAFKLFMSGKGAGDLGKKPLDEVINMDELMQDMDFAENVSLMYLPDNYPKEKANREFLGLYKLLKAMKEYVPELPMEYVLYYVIYNEVWQVDQINEDMEDGFFDDLMDDPFFDGIEDEEATTVERISEPDRTIVRGALEAEVKAVEESEDDDNEDSFTAEDYINMFEDLREYKEVCFWDTDFAILDEITEDELIQSDAAKILGISERQDIKTIEFSTDGRNKVRMEMNNPPWENEE